MQLQSLEIKKKMARQGHQDTLESFEEGYRHRRKIDIDACDNICWKTCASEIF
jgi:hypothetical protein